MAISRQGMKKRRWLGRIHKGRLAYRFAQSGALDQVTGCKAKGWTIEKNNCYPNAMKDGSLNGWKMP
jgi:hypothetical protein